MTKFAHLERALRQRCAEIDDDAPSYRIHEVGPMPRVEELRPLERGLLRLDGPALNTAALALGVSTLDALIAAGMSPHQAQRVHNGVVPADLWRRRVAAHLGVAVSDLWRAEVV